MRVHLVPVLAAASCFGHAFATQEIPNGFSFAQAGGAGRNVIVGTGDPNIDVQAVQAAADRGGNVLLAGHFSFNRAIRLRGEFPEWPMAGATIVDSDITMSAPLDTVFGTNSAAIEIRGFALGNVVLNNRIRGRARSSLAVVSYDMGVPGNNTLVLNDMEGFQLSFANVFVDAGVTNTLIVGRKGTVMDRGTGTVITDAVAAALPPRAEVRVQRRPQ